MPKRNRLWIAQTGPWVEVTGMGQSWSERSGRGLRSAVEESDGEGGQPLGSGGCGIENVKLSGTVDDELSGSTVAPRRKGSWDDRLCESKGWKCGSVDASDDTSVEL